MIFTIIQWIFAYLSIFLLKDYGVKFRLLKTMTEYPVSFVGSKLNVEKKSSLIKINKETAPYQVLPNL